MKDYSQDPRTVLTLDAGGTNFVFSAMRYGREVATPVHLHTDTSSAEACVAQLKEGFGAVLSQLGGHAEAISFAFPGPADYPQGILGDLPNFPCFRGGFPLGPILEDAFGIPVYINNDGDLFAYGEALAGSLPQVNARLEQMGSSKRFHNLIGVTLGTGYGCGVVLDGRLLRGDNSSGGDIWCLRGSHYPDMIVEESVSIRAVKREYARLSGSQEELTPKDIYDIAEGTRPGHRDAAIKSLAMLGEAAADALASVVTVVDGLIVIGGGLAGAGKYILPAMLQVLNGRLGSFGGQTFARLQMKAYNLDDESIWPEFARGEERCLQVPGSGRTLVYDSLKRIGVMTTPRKTSQSIALGAYAFALEQLG